ncbi:putative ribosome biogenesis protein NEP1 [Trachymyrmex septentrionalis]|uniref:Putative ribosome biogenesis protein NEP1 n=1 Tax=Trachymyrmex septentrionalis TaxID=34720 RepID=A0A195FXN5_9HYME|nr:putative ribosome biogenesis protein NEP1 [Trachymyrmex septentrionalis]
MGNKKKKRVGDDYEYDLVPKHLQIDHIKNKKKRLIVILENSQLESVKVGNSFEVLNCDNHKILMSFNANKVVKTDYTEDINSINYLLSGAIACSKLCTAFEEVWEVV